ncbi:DUF805 domain-containing protein [Bacillus changyiensis]|uniref:DUF805 domain-containing protein n=1 Tax=Bacillus changyiensis TaxID=3004103 RepID=UPI0022E37106|nr:DUF805 domain-containing protein [Bacillus changyiensis]MDA1476070.1 DUF805 domain-containing protein [Bacillus changyiensis]
MKWYLKVFKDVKFEGRARRKEFWFFSLFNVIMSFFFVFAGIILIYLIISFDAARSGIDSYEIGYVSGYLGSRLGIIMIILYLIAIFVPAHAVGYRRIQDTGKSGEWVWLNLIPLIGAIILVLVFFCRDSEAKDNQYGPNPKATLKE